MATVDKSGIDVWLLAVLAAPIAGAIFAVAATLTMRSSAAGATAAFIAVTGIGPPLWLLASARFTFDPGQPEIRSVPFKWRIPVAGITAISPASNPVASPALSLHRLRLDYGVRRLIMLSPRDKQRLTWAVATARSHVP